jgi:hypothetical protein
MRFVSCGLVFALTLISLSGCTLDQIAAEQEKATGLWDEMVAGEAFGQSFLSSHDNLYRIDLSTATYARTNSAPVIFHLQDDPGASQDILYVTLPGSGIQNERPTSIRFPPLPDSGGKFYYFYIESPEGTPGDAITVYANAQDRYAAGSAYRNHQAVPGDLAFTAYSRETFVFSNVLGDFLSRAAQDLPFFLCYSIVVLGLCAGMILTFWRGATGKKQAEP